MSAWAAMRAAFAAAMVVLIVHEPGPGQGLAAGVDHRGQADVARLGHQQRDHRGGQVLHPGRAVTEMHEGVEEDGPGVHLEQQVRQVDLREHLLDPPAQPGQRLRLAERAELVDVQLHPPVVLDLDGDLRLRAGLFQAGRELFTSGVQAPHQRVVREEPADVAHGAHLEGEAELVVRRAPQRDQVAVDVVQEKEPLQFGAGRLLGELSVRLGLLISQKLHGHEADRSQPRVWPSDLSANPSGARRCASRP